MSKKLFVGFTGVKESGKTTAFEAIKKKYPQVEEVMLAKKLKDTCAEVLGIPRNYFDDQAFKEVLLDNPVYLSEDLVKGLYESYDLTVDYEQFVRPHIGKLLHTPREAAQYVGTEVLRAVDPDIHCNAAIKFVPDAPVYIVTDMRFWNEFDFFNGNSEIEFSSFYIQNNKAEAKLGPNPHASEKFVLEIGKKCEYKIANDGTNLSPFESLVVASFDQAAINRGFKL